MKLSISNIAWEEKDDAQMVLSGSKLLRQEFSRKSRMKNS